MIRLRIDCNSDVMVFIEEHESWEKLPWCLVERSSLVQGLMRDFDGPQCSTTLPLSVDAFMLWSSGKLGCLEQAADLLNVADFLKDTQLPVLMHAVAQQLVDAMTTGLMQARSHMPKAAVQCLQCLPASLKLPLLRRLPLHTILSDALAAVHNAGVLAHVNQASRSLCLQAPNSIPLQCRSSPQMLFAGLPSLDSMLISFEDPESCDNIRVASVYDRWVAGWMPPFFQWLQGLNQLRSLSLSHLQLPPSQFGALTRSLLQLTALTHIAVENSSVFPKTLRVPTSSNSRSRSSSGLLPSGSHSLNLNRTSEDLNRRARTLDSGRVGIGSNSSRQRSVSSASGELSTSRRRLGHYTGPLTTLNSQLRSCTRNIQAPSLSSLPNLRSLSLAHTDYHLLGYRSAREFGADLACMRSMKALNLEGSLSTNDAVHIVCALRSAKVLDCLNIADAPLSGSAASEKLRGLLMELPTSLRSLNISQHTVPSRQKHEAQSNAASAELHPNDVIGAGLPQMLDMNPNGAAPATQGAPTIAWPTTLTSLTISGRSCVLMQAKDISAEALLGSCRALQNLSKLELTSPSVVGPARLGTLTAVLVNMRHLEHLHLGPSQGTDEGDSVTDRLASSIAALTALTTLRMELCWLTAAQLGVAVAPLKRLKRLGLSNVRPRDLAPVRGGSIWQPPPAVALVDALHESAAPLTHIELDDYRPFARVIYTDVRACSLSSVLLDTSTLQSVTLRACGMDGDALAALAGGVASGATPMLRRIRLHAAGPVALLPFLFFVHVMNFDEAVEVHEWDMGPDRSIVTVCGSSAKVADIELTDLMLWCNCLVNN